MTDSELIVRIKMVVNTWQKSRDCSDARDTKAVDEITLLMGKRQRLHGIYTERHYRLAAK